MKNSSPIIRAAWALGILTLLAISVSLIFPTAQESPPAETLEPAEEFAPGTAALRVMIDPETGQLTSDRRSLSKAADPELQNMLSRSTEGLKEVVHPDGHVSVNLQGRFMSATVARLNENGEVESACVEDSGTAQRFLDGESIQTPHDGPEVK